METPQDQNVTSTNSADADNALTNGTVQEVSSTTPADDVVTKRTLRVQTWKKLKENRSASKRFNIFNKIPDFFGNSKAAALLAETEEFKKAGNIKVNVDRPQDAIRLEVISNGKNLYVTPFRESNAIYTKVECAPDADERTKRLVLRRLRENRTDISLENKVVLDMVVVGSVIVSKEGHRIGKGNGFVDLDLGVLIQTGVVTPETVIVTTVHDDQVTDALPKELFQKFDCPVDMIVTPTQVIRVEKKLPRPEGVFWEILSERRCKIVQILQTIKENEEKSGKIITLKSEDTDIETRPRFRQRRRFFNNRNFNRNRTRSQGNNDNRENSRGGGGSRRIPPRRFMRRRPQTKSESEQTSGDNKEKNINQNRNQNRMRKRRITRNYCFKVSNIAKGVRVKDLKAELKKRECNPIYITWKGFGKCYLHFAKRNGSDIDSLTESLRDLKLTIQNGEETKTVDLAVELLPERLPQQQNDEKQQQNNGEVNKSDNINDQRIESVSATSV